MKNKFFEDSCEEEWQDMPEFIQNDLPPFKRIFLDFKNQKEVDRFCSLTGLKILDKTKSLWFCPKGKTQADSYMSNKEVWDGPKKKINTRFIFPQKGGGKVD